MGGKKIAGSRILPKKSLVESERREREVELRWEEAELPLVSRN